MRQLKFWSCCWYRDGDSEGCCDFVPIIYKSFVMHHSGTIFVVVAWSWSNQIVYTQNMRRFIVNSWNPILMVCLCLVHHLPTNKSRYCKSDCGKFSTKIPFIKFQVVDPVPKMSTGCQCPIGLTQGPTLATLCGGSQFMLFMGLLEVFIRSQCDLEDPCGRPKVSQIVKVLFTHYR